MPFSRNNARLILLALAVGASGGLLLSAVSRASVEGSVAFFVRNERRAPETLYDYDGYYTLQAAQIAASTLAHFLRSPGGVEAVWREAGITKRVRRIRLYERVLDIRQQGTPFLEIRFKADTDQDARRLAGAIERKLSGELRALQGSQGTLSLSAAAATFVRQPVSRWRNALAGGFTGTALVVAWLLARAALRRNVD